MKKVLFIDRDGTLLVEPPVTEQVNSLEEMEFIPGVIRNMNFIAGKLDFELVIVSNQDGLGTDVYPQESFDSVQSKMIQIFKGEGVEFDNVLIDKSFPEENLPTRKPNPGLLKEYLNGDYDIANSYVIGDRLTDLKLAKNIGSKSILLSKYSDGIVTALKENDLTADLITDSWDEITKFLFAGERTAEIKRKTSETDIYVKVDLDGHGKTSIETGLGFFNHMLEQIGKHSGMDLTIITKGDLNVDEHHTMEDTAIALGEAILKALGDKRGIDRYGFCLPMDDCLCSVALDFGGRPWLVWDVEFKREMIGDTPTEMFFHFFKSFSDAARINLNIKAEGNNEHHKIEGIFKALARSLKMAIKRDIYRFELPSTKGML